METIAKIHKTSNCKEWEIMGCSSPAETPAISALSQDTGKITAKWVEKVQELEKQDSWCRLVSSRCGEKAAPMQSQQCCWVNYIMTSNDMPTWTEEFHMAPPLDKELQVTICSWEREHQFHPEKDNWITSCPLLVVNLDTCTYRQF